MKKDAKQKLFAKAFAEASGKDAMKAGSAFFDAANDQGVFQEQKDEIAKRIQNLGAKFGLKNLKQPSSSVLDEVSIGDVNKDKDKNKNVNPLDSDVSLDKVGIKKNFNIGDFTLGANVNQPFEGDTEFGITGSGEILPNVNLNLNLTNKNQNAMMNFNKRF